MIRTFFLVLLLGISLPSLAEIRSINFEGLEFPLSPAWSNLTIIDSGFGVRIDETERPTGPGTLSATTLKAQEHILELEDGSEISLVTLLVDHLRGHEERAPASPRKEAISESFQSSSRFDHEVLELYIEDEPFLPDTFKAYIVRSDWEPIEVSATMKLDDFEHYLRKIQPILKP